MVIVFGSINLDLIFPVAVLPAAGDTVLTPNIRIEPGGKGANQAVAAARDGSQVIMAGAVGRDALAAGALAAMREAGIDLSRVRETNGGTGCAAIFVDAAGGNLIGVGSGANLAARADQVEDALLTPATTLLLQLEVSATETAVLVRRAHGRGCRVLLNLAPAGSLDPDALRSVDLLIVNEREAAWLASRLGARATAQDLHGALGVTVLCTLGERGAEAAGNGGAFAVPAHPIAVVDTTGAGDCFAGVLGATLDRGMSLEAAMRRASVAAALCCARPGSQRTMPLGAETDAAFHRPA